MYDDDIVTESCSVMLATRDIKVGVQLVHGFILSHLLALGPAFAGVCHGDWA